MKKKYLIFSLLGSVAVASVAGVAAVATLNNKTAIKEELADNTFLEDTSACDDVFSNGLLSIAANDRVSYKQGATESDLYAPKLGVQFATNTTNNTVSIRYCAAITSLNVKAVWERTVYDQSGNIVKGTKNVEVTKAYTGLKDGDNTLMATDVVADDSTTPYKYFVVYVLKNIPLDSNGDAAYKLDCKLTLSQDENKVSTPTGTVNAKAGSSISECEINVSLDTNYSYKGSGTAAGNGQYINGKLKTIYASTDTTLNTDYLSLNVSKTVGNETTTSTVYYTDFSTKNVTISGFEAGTTGKQTILVNDGAASYDIYVLNTNSAYQDADENYVVTVDKSYTGEIGAVSGTNGNMFKTVGQALEFLQNTAFVPASANKILNIGAGYYKEKLEITTPNLTINGAGATRATYEDDVNYNAASYAASTIIEFDTLYGEYAPGLTDVNQQHTTDSTQTVAVRDTATNCKISGVTISNYYNNIARYEGTSHEGNGERGLALLCQADQFQMVECSLLGWQDTVEFFTGRQYIVDSYVCGAVDFIFGTNSTTYFNGCIIESIASKSNSQDGNVVAYVTAFKGINKDSTDAKTYGAIFNECVFTNSSDFVGKYAIARPWTAYSNVAVVNSTFAGNAATTETTTIATGLINDVNVSTLNIKFYGNKDDNENAFTLTDDLTNVNTTLTSDANYATYAAAFSTGNGYAVSWDPEALPIIEKDIIFNSSGNYSTSSIVDLTEFTLAEEKNDTVGFRGKIKISVNANSIVEINGYSNSYTHFTVDSYNVYYNSSFYYATAGTLVIDTGSTTSYINSIKIYENITEETPVTLSGITLENTPVNEYAVGDDYDISGLKVKASYSNNTYEYVTNYTINDTSVVDKTKAGTYTVTVSYGGFEKTFDITYVSSVSNVFDEDFKITFGSTGNYAGLSKLDQTNAHYGQVQTSCTQIAKDSILSFYVEAGATIHISGNWSVGYDINGTKVKTTNAGGTDDTGLEYDYYCAEGGQVTITALHNNNYFYYIDISYPAQSNVITEATNLMFGEDYGNYSSNSKFTITATINDNNRSNNAMVYGGNIEFTVAAGAKVEVFANYSADYDINGTKVSGLVGDEGQKFYTFDTQTDVVIKCDTDSSGDNYFYWIKITFPNS